MKVVDITTSVSGYVSQPTDVMIIIFSKKYDYSFPLKDPKQPPSKPNEARTEFS